MLSSFDNLNSYIPYCTDGELHSVITPVYDDVQVKSPGKYAEETKGGDFVVETLVGDKWVPYRHADFFLDIGKKADTNQAWVLSDYLPTYISMLHDDEPVLLDIPGPRGKELVWSGVEPNKMLRTLQVIAVTEHRRYPKSEPLGGRYLLLRFLTGIACGLWDAELAASYLKSGKVGLKKLRHRTGYTEPTIIEILEGIEVG